MKITSMHRTRVGSWSPSRSGKSSLSKPRYLLWVLDVGLILLVSALLSLAALSPITLVSAKAPSWHRVALPLGLGGLISTINCFSSTSCRIGGEGPKGAVLLNSTDSGTSWHSVGLPLSHGAQILTINCPSSTTCLAGGMGGSTRAALLRSGNGGVTWHRVALPPGLGLRRLHAGAIITITCPSSTTCLLAGLSPKGAVLLRSTDTGSSWDSVAHPPGLAHDSSGLGAIYTITCPSSTTCLAGGQGTNGPVLLRSTDTGISWDSVALPPGPELPRSMGQNWPELHKYAYSNCTVGIRPVRVHTNATDSIHLQEFRILTHAPRHNLDAIRTINCPSSTTCLAGGLGPKGAVLLRSTNGGTSWHSVALPSNLGLHAHTRSVFGAIGTIDCPSSTTCLAGGQGAKGAVLLRSTNGGTSWDSVTLPPGLEHNSSGLGIIYTIACPSSTTCLAGGGGNKGPVLLSTSSTTGSRLTSTLIVLGGVVVLLLILGVVALALRRRRSARSGAL